MNACLRKGGENVASNQYCYTISADKQIVQLYNHAAGMVSLKVKDILSNLCHLGKVD